MKAGHLLLFRNLQNPAAAIKLLLNANWLQFRMWASIFFNSMKFSCRPSGRIVYTKCQTGVKPKLKFSVWKNRWGKCWLCLRR